MSPRDPAPWSDGNRTSRPETGPPLTQALTLLPISFASQPRPPLPRFLGSSYCLFLSWSPYFLPTKPYFSIKEEKKKVGKEGCRSKTGVKRNGGTRLKSRVSKRGSFPLLISELPYYLRGSYFSRYSFVFHSQPSPSFVSHRNPQQRRADPRSVPDTFVFFSPWLLSLASHHFLSQQPISVRLARPLTRFYSRPHFQTTIPIRRSGIRSKTKSNKTCRKDTARILRRWNDKQTAQYTKKGLSFLALSLSLSRSILFSFVLFRKHPRHPQLRNFSTDWRILFSSPIAVTSLGRRRF